MKNETYWYRNLTIGTTKAKKTKYKKIVDIYWQLKTINARVLVKRSKEQQKIFLRLDETHKHVRKLNAKVIRLAKALVDVEFLAFHKDNIPPIIIEEDTPSN